MNPMRELGLAAARVVEVLDALEPAEHDLPVAACPGWTIRDLALHLGAIHRWAAATVLSAQRVPEPEPRVTSSLADWYAGCATALIAALQAVDPAEQVPNFSRVDETAAFWARRQAHETTVHVVDLLQALGRPESEWAVSTDVADDGIAEVLRIFFARLTATGRRPDVRSAVRLEASDTGGLWVVAPGPEETSPPLLRAATTPARDTIRGRVVDLYLALWGRVGSDRLEVRGQAAEAMLAGPLTP